MVTYTTQEKYAVINILIQIIEADTIIHEKEIEYMNQILSELSITPRDIEYIEELLTKQSGQDLVKLLNCSTMTIQLKRERLIIHQMQVQWT